MSGPREEDGDYARDFFDTYERAADALVRPTPADRDEDERGCTCGLCHWSPEYQIWVP